MPDANDRIRPVFFTMDAEKWTRIFSVEDECEVCGHLEGHCEGEDPDCPDNELEIVFGDSPRRMAPRPRRQAKRLRADGCRVLHLGGPP